MNSNLRAITILTLLVILFSPARSQSRSGRDETALRAIEQGLARAYVKRDRAFVDRVLDSEWTVIDAVGRILDKSQVMRESFDSTDRRVEAARIDRVKVRIYGDSAIVTGRSWARGSYRGQKMEATFLFTDLFVRRNRQWKVVSSQATLLPNETTNREKIPNKPPRPKRTPRR